MKTYQKPHTNMSNEKVKAGFADLVAFDEVEAQLSSVRQEYQGLRINGPADKDGYAIVRKAWQNLRDIRLSAEKLHKVLKADALAYGKACDARLRQIKDALTPMEDDFYEQWKAEDTRKEREAAEAIARAEAERKARIQSRENALYAIGMAWTGSAFASQLPGVSDISRAQVDGLDDDPFAAALTVLKAQVEVAQRQAAEEEARRVEAERKVQEEADRLEAQRAELERVQKELAEREAKVNATIESTRAAELAALGAIAYEYPADPLRQYDDDQWAEEVRQVKVLVDRRVAEEREAAARAEAEAKQRAEREAKDREEREARIAAEAAQKERERIAAEEQRKAEAEAERVRMLGDAGAIQKAISDLVLLENYCHSAELKSAVSAQGMAKALEHLHKAYAELKEVAKSIAA